MDTDLLVHGTLRGSQLPGDRGILGAYYHQWLLVRVLPRPSGCRRGCKLWSGRSTLCDKELAKQTSSAQVSGYYVR